MNDSVQSAELANPHEQLWFTIFGVGHPDLKRFQRLHLRLPSAPRCKLCYAPFHGIGGLLMRFRGRAPSNKNPRYCSRCDFFLRRFPGGAEVETTILFLDVRGSSRLAETLSALAFSRAMQRFYAQTFPIINENDGFILDVRGDGLLALFPPGFSGRDHANKALTATERLLRLSAASADDALRFGIGVHTGIAYVGTMTGQAAGVEDVTVLGDAANVAARLCALAKPGEAWVSEATYAAAARDRERLECRAVEIKGRQTAIQARMCRHAQ